LTSPAAADDARVEKWVRFAPWDVATNGAFVNQVRLSAAPTATSSSAGREKPQRRRFDHRQPPADTWTVRDENGECP
jgi:hypothetical protein